MLPLVCIDVDGTLVGTSGEVLPAVWAAAERARSRGMRLALCSGRPCFGRARGYASRLDADGWHVFQNGASVVHLPTGETRSAVMPAATVEMLIDRARRFDRPLELYSDTDYVVEKDSERARDHAALLGVPFAPRPFEALSGAVVRAQWLLSRGEPEAVLDEAYPGIELSPSSSPVNPTTLFVGMTRAGVSKASGIRAVAEALGVPLDRVMFVGDAHNDLDGLRAVGFPVAMGNADAEIKAVSRHQVGHVDEGGLAGALDLALSL
jgi:hypothetical protein